MNPNYSLILRRRPYMRGGKDLPIELKWRVHDLGGTDYGHVAYISRNAAVMLEAIGAAHWLYPDEREG